MASAWNTKQPVLEYTGRKTGQIAEDSELLSPLKFHTFKAISCSPDHKMPCLKQQKAAVLQSPRIREEAF